MASRKVDWESILEQDAEEDDRIEKIKQGQKPKPRHKPKGNEHVER